MAEYIEKETAITTVGRNTWAGFKLAEIPAADVVEVRHASWIEDGYYNKPCVCSNCGEPCKDTVMGKPRWNYCPNCGATMDGGQDE